MLRSQVLTPLNHLTDLYYYPLFSILLYSNTRLRYYHSFPFPAIIKTRLRALSTEYKAQVTTNGGPDMDHFHVIHPNNTIRVTEKYGAVIVLPTQFVLFS